MTDRELLEALARVFVSNFLRCTCGRIATVVVLVDASKPILANVCDRCPQPVGTRCPVAHSALAQDIEQELDERSASRQKETNGHRWEPSPERSIPGFDVTCCARCQLLRGEQFFTHDKQRVITEVVYRGSESPMWQHDERACLADAPDRQPGVADRDHVER